MRIQRTASVCAALCMACMQAEESAITEAEIVVDGDASLMVQLQRVRASVHALDALTAWSPLQERDFLLAQGGSAGPGEVLPPLTFGVFKSKADRFELVIEGFASREARAEPVIERKVRVSFEPNQRVRVVVSLRETCRELSRPCTSLTETCDPDARACGPVPDARDTSAVDARAPLGGDAPTARACPADHGCSADYPCVSTDPDGYTCLGQYADWPTPMMGSPVPPDYDHQSDPRVVIDRVTGLVWQRELPAAYLGCSGAASSVGDTCAWDDAKRYCQQLQLAGRTWRLPSKIELESLIETTAGSPTLVAPAFPPVGWTTFWTASPNPFAMTREEMLPRMWTVSFREGLSGYVIPSQPHAVRCVSGVPRGGATPAARYRVDAATDTVVAVRTGLTWQRSNSGPLVSLEDAQRFCMGLDGGFRVPMVKEVMTLVDPTRSEPAVDPAFFRAPARFGWATALRADGSLEPWYFDLEDGATYSVEYFEYGRERYDISKHLPPFVRCVR